MDRPPAGHGGAFTGSGPLTGTLEKLQVDQTLTAPFPARLAAVLDEPLYDLRFDGRLVFSDVNPHLLKADLPDLPASGEVAVKGTVDAFSSSGTVRALVGQALMEGVGPVAVTYRAARDGADWRIDSAAITLPGTATRIDASGLVKAPIGQPVAIEGKASWQNLRWPLRGSAPTVASARGNATINGTLDAYHAEVQADLTQVPGGEIAAGRWTLAGDGTQERFRFDRFQGTVLSGRLNGRGEVAWKPQVRWNLSLRGDGINPKTLAPDYAGNLSFEATTRGTLSDAGPVGTVSVPRLNGVLRGQPVAGAVNLDLHGQRMELPHLNLTWGTASIAANGRVGADARSRLEGGGAESRHRGPPGWRLRRRRGPDLRRHENAAHPGPRPGRIAALRRCRQHDQHRHREGGRRRRSRERRTVHARSPCHRRALRRATPHELTVQGRGTQGNHTITTTALIEEGRLDLALAGGIAGELGSTATWNGTIQRLDLTSKPTGTWRLGGPAPLAASAAAVRLRDFCLSGGLNGPGNARLCAAGDWAKTGPWDVNSTIADLPIDSFRAFLPTDLRITGDINGKVAARGTNAVLAERRHRPATGAGRDPLPRRRRADRTFRYEQGCCGQGRRRAAPATPRPASRSPGSAR